jgi:hypothetical protein
VGCLDFIRVPAFLFADLCFSVYVAGHVGHRFGPAYGRISFIVTFCVLAGLWHCLWYGLARFVSWLEEKHQDRC